MHRLGLPPSGGGVYFGQLLGMADALTFTLGQNGYSAFKYVPYGPIGEVRGLMSVSWVEVGVGVGADGSSGLWIQGGELWFWVCQKGAGGCERVRQAHPSRTATRRAATT